MRVVDWKEYMIDLEIISKQFNSYAIRGTKFRQVRYISDEKEGAKN
jgi:hypothetical protein